ncbi:hypothetical protein LTR08_001254 [Meristemomyces frigidus]|nr:hypothetical protein LTR08_001254 [Meristemomyces frigidus]
MPPLLTTQPEETLENPHFQTHPAAWHHPEPMQTFLRRLPVDKPSTAAIGPWLWVGNPQTTARLLAQRQREDVPAFIAGAKVLLTAFSARKGEIEAVNPGKAAGTLTKHVRPYREELEDGLVDLAVETATTSGKWMLFPAPADLARTWRLVAEATAAGRLGPL